EIPDAETSLINDGLLVPDRLVEREFLGRIDQKEIGLVAIEDRLRLEYQRAPLVLVGLTPLRLRHLVVFGADIARELETSDRGAGVIEIEVDLVGIAARRPPRHLVGRDVPAAGAAAGAARMPNHAELLRARHRSDRHVEAELLPCLHDQRRALEHL